MYEELLSMAITIRSPRKKIKLKKVISITMLCETFSANGEENHTKLVTASTPVLHLNDKMPVADHGSMCEHSG